MPLDHLEDHIRRTESNIPSNTDVFETFWVTDNGNVFMLDEHLERMKKSVGELELGETPDIERLSDEIREMTQKKNFTIVFFAWNTPRIRTDPQIIRSMSGRRNRGWLQTCRFDSCSRRLEETRKAILFPTKPGIIWRIESRGGRQKNADTMTHCF